MPYFYLVMISYNDEFYFYPRQLLFAGPSYKSFIAQELNRIYLYNR